VTVVGHDDLHGAYVDALVAELALSRALLADELETVFSGGTPTLTEWPALERLLARLPQPRRSRWRRTRRRHPGARPRLQRAGVTRVSLGAQSFQPRLLEVLERRARPDDVRRSVHHLRDANFDNISLDLIYGIPGQSTSDLGRDLDAALALEPSTCPATSWSEAGHPVHACARRRARRQADAMEGYFELVVERLTAAGYRWYETANFCGRMLTARPARAAQPRVLARRDYLGLGIGAVSTSRSSAGARRQAAGLPRRAARGELPPRELERSSLSAARERVLLGLRLDEPLGLAGLDDALDQSGLQRMNGSGSPSGTARAGATELTLTRRGRFLGGGVTVELLA